MRCQLGYSGPGTQSRRSRSTPEPPDDIDAAFPLAIVEILQQNVAAAFDRLFDLFDPADPEVIAGRRKLANALY
jgi:thioredoxin-like negative regulator of GroEL